MILMPLYKIECEWTEYSVMRIEAKTKEEAINAALGYRRLTEGVYIEDSFRVVSTEEVD